jgi:hypothetical protein
VGSHEEQRRRARRLAGHRRLAVQHLDAGSNTQPKEGNHSTNIEREPNKSNERKQTQTNGSLS